MKSKEKFLAKITRPSVSGICFRERLFRLIGKGRSLPILWVTGPPGSGKTVLVASYIEARGLPCLWYQIDERDSDIGTFFYYMGMAARKAAPRNRKPLPLLTSEYLAGIPAFTRRFFEDLYSRLGSPSVPMRKGDRSKVPAVKDGFVIVLDNYQDIPAGLGFHDMMAHALDVIPEGGRVIIMSRNEPPPALARLQANNRVWFLGWNEIRFTLEETREVLQAKGERSLPKEAVVQIHKRTDGWVAALVLMILNLRSQGIEYPSFLRDIPKELISYLENEIFRKADRERQVFLLKTVFLSKMTAQMAEKLTGITRAGKILNELNESSCFTERYSEDSPVYQYHPLFREFLLSKVDEVMGPSEVSVVRRNAALIMEESSRVEEAAALYREMKDWDGLIRLIGDHSQSLTGQGRNKTLQSWIESIPDQIRKQRPWLLYWLGLCKQPYSPFESRALFDQAFQLFEGQGDAAGIYLSWSGAVDTIVFEWNDFTSLDRWIRWLEGNRERIAFPSLEVEARVTSSMAGALLYRQPYHPDIQGWMEQSLSLCREMEDENSRMHAYLYAVDYYSWTGDLARCGTVAGEIGGMAKLPAASGLLLLTWKWINALIHNRTAEEWKASLALVAEGLEIADRNGIHVWDQMLFAQGVYASLNKRDLVMAEAFLKKMERILDRHRRHGLYQYHYLAGWCCLLREDLSGALSHADSALRLAGETGMYFAGILCNLLMAQVLHEKGEDGSVSPHLSTANELSRKSGSPMLEYMCLIKEAQFTLGQASGGAEKSKSEKQGLEALRRAMALGREHGYLGLFPWWQPSAMANLCARALAVGIEVNYVRNLVRKHRFFPDDPPLDIDNWPWPIRITTLGKFEIVREDKPLRFSGTVQKKPLLMLKVLIALGGTAVNVEQVSDLLWPDADGDQARTSFKVTLSRLRHQIGSEQALEVDEGKLTINPRYCWVDAWAFERICGKVAAFLKKSSLSTPDSKHLKENVAEATGWMEKVMGTYKAHFLLMEEEAWAISYRERLRGKFIDVIGKLGNYFQHTGQWQKAIGCYEKAIEVDDLAEEVYQRLMLCYQKFDQVAKAISVYRRLVKTLSSVLGIEPSPRTEAIYRELMGKFQVRNPSSSEKL